MVIWRGDFSTGDLSQWTGVESNDPASRLQVVDAPMRPGTKALRVMLRQQDFIPQTNGVRNEVWWEGTPRLSPEGSERWYRWSTLFPADYPVIQQWQVWTQWHQSYRPDGTTVGRSPPVEFAINKDRLQFNIHPASGAGARTLWTAPIPRGSWMDIVLHVLWASTSAGFVELTVNGQLVVPRTPAITVFPGLAMPDRPNYLKQGLYRAREIASEAVVYHQGMVCADAAADVASVTASPAAIMEFALTDASGGRWTLTLAKRKAI